MIRWMWSAFAWWMDRGRAATSNEAIADLIVRDARDTGIKLWAAPKMTVVAPTIGYRRWLVETEDDVAVFNTEEEARLHIRSLL